MYQNELYHHGIKGQKWGVRRYQNKNGSLTNAGRKRYSEEELQARKKSRKKITKKIAKGVAATGVLALAAYGISNKNIRNTVTTKLKDFATSQKTKDFVKNQGKKMIKSFSDSASKAGKAMTDAALVSIGTIQISRLSKKLETNSDGSEAAAERNKLILDVATAGINSVTKANKGTNTNSNNQNKGNNVGSDVSNIIGAPSKKGLDKSSSEYQNLFKDNSGNQRDSETRSTIKSLANAGYDADQIKRYLDDLDNGRIKHSADDIAFITSVYIGKDFIESIM